MKRLFLIPLAVLLLFSCPYVVTASGIPNSLFSEHAVLQRNARVPVWGTARNGEKIRIEFDGQTLKTVASNGVWMVRLKPMKAGGPYTMRIISDTTIAIADIFVGEVWVCSGQSNMGFRMKQGVVNGEQEIAAASYPLIRQFSVPYHAAHEPVADTKGKWQVCSPENVKAFTAVGYFLHETYINSCMYLSVSFFQPLGVRPRNSGPAGMRLNRLQNLKASPKILINRSVPTQTG